MIGIAASGAVERTILLAALAASSVAWQRMNRQLAVGMTATCLGCEVLGTAAVVARVGLGGSLAIGYVEGTFFLVKK